MQRLLALSALGFVLVGCGPNDQTSDVNATAPAKAERIIETASPDYWGEWGIDLGAKNTAIAAGDDFFLHANGTWYDNFEIPDDKTRYGAFDLLREKSEQRVKFIIEDLADAKPDPASLEGKIGAIYNAFMDEDTIEARGLDPVLPYLETINAIDSRAGLADVFGKPGFSAPIGGWVDIDSKEIDNYIFYVTQAGLGIGDRDYYLEDTEKNQEILAAYRVMLIALLSQANSQADAAAQADSVIALETDIAKAHWDRAVGRNRDLTYNKMSKQEFVQMSGGFPVQDMLATLSLDGQENFIIRQVQPDAEEIATLGLDIDQVAKISGGGIAGIMAIANTGDLDAWKAWLTVQLLTDNASVLPKAIDEAVFAFYGKTLSGQEAQRDRWKRAVSAVEGAMGEGIGKVYAARHFPNENKVAMDSLVANLRTAMDANLVDLPWMGEETKVQAGEKLSKFTPKIGYPEKFETYDTLSVSSDAFGNAMAVGKWQWDDMLSNLGQPIDKTEWFMFPQTVNAYYSPNRNEIVFPAAILQPPFFNIDADPAVNYGAIGGVIGHEIGHGFDDQGSRSDGNGVLRNWWTDADNAAFKDLTGALIGQYNGFCPLDDGETCINGALSLGENIGDLGGLSLAYRAYQMSLNGEEAPVIDGLTGDQRFFLAWAQVWRSKYREEALRRQLQTGPHSPPYFRVNGIVRNMDAWYEAFGVTQDNALYLPPEDRIQIW